MLFLSLPFLQWHGWMAALLGVFILLEISITIWDFNIEVIERAPLGGVANRERGLHLVMAVVYGYFLAQLVPQMIEWFSEPTGFVKQTGIPSWIPGMGILFGVLVILSGIRDLLASRGLRFFQRDLFRRRS
jgi:hypothetical protein